MDNFVSISGVATRDELEGIARIRSEEGIKSCVIGWQASNKSINQGVNNPRQPRFSEIGELCRMAIDYGMTNAIHYYTKDISTTQADLERIIDKGVGPKNTLVQFNTLPPDIQTLMRAKERGFRIIFKVAVADKRRGGYAVWKGDGVEDAESGDVELLVKQVEERREDIDYVLFDPSHGTGLELDLSDSSLGARFGGRIMSEPGLNHLGMVYAGGIKPANTGEVTKRLRKLFGRRASIDIESGVRTTDNELSLDLVREYLRSCQKL